jgi:hypothetical protein
MRTTATTKGNDMAHFVSDTLCKWSDETIAAAREWLLDVCEVHDDGMEIEEASPEVIVYNIGRLYVGGEEAFLFAGE